MLFQPFTERDVRLAVDRLSHLLAEHGFAVKDLRTERPDVCVVAAVGS